MSVYIGCFFYLCGSYFCTLILHQLLVSARKAVLEVSNVRYLATKFIDNLLIVHVCYQTVVCNALNHKVTFLCLRFIYA